MAPACGLSIPASRCLQTGPICSDNALDDNRRAVDDACTIGARCLVLVVGGLPPGSRDIAGARDQVRDGIAKLLEHSRAAGMPLAIEPLHRQCQTKSA